MPKPSDFIEVITSLGVITIYSQRMCALTFLGSNFKTPSKVGDKSLHFSFSVEPRTSGIIILRICTKLFKGVSSILLLLEVKNGVLDLNSFWEPKHGVLVTAHDNFLYVLSENKNRYTNNPILESEEYFVADEFDLCLFITGKRGEAYLLDITTQNPSHIDPKEILIPMPRKREDTSYKRSFQKNLAGRRHPPQEKSKKRIPEIFIILLSLFFLLFLKQSSIS
jgi:hypothetical protein